MNDDKLTHGDMHQKAPASAGPATRVNIIFHGLMAFHECGDKYHVLIPKSLGHMPHEAKYGDPLNAANPQYYIQTLNDFCDGYYEVIGLDGCIGRSCRPAPHANVVLQNTMLVPQPDAVRVTISLPKPDLVRGFRAVEVRNPSFGLGDLAIGDCTHNALSRQPDILYEVTMFSYFMTGGTTPELVVPDDCDNPANPAFYSNGSIWNLCVYSQTLNDLGGVPDHDDMFNAMFQVRSRNGALEPLKLQLFVQADGGSNIADGPCATPPSVGIDPVELWNLAELGFQPNLKVISQPHGLDPTGAHVAFNVTCSDPSGCSAGWGEDDPNAS